MTTRTAAETSDRLVDRAFEAGAAAARLYGPAANHRAAVGIDSAEISS